ncbi:SRPBCC domain-containing protein [Agromyces archimandritae]|uniref:SRPBCC domain-containing protein n=1 Tax=Agromyces archimandritae TaxID=2781962 RepID=A0A975FLS6_9MICO|nr:SRPBCC domain-containing protein [Agromyces archimandritae]QTX03808.1 SRPBCC domain-containing protein [Agromyces archimandritae]
MTEIAEDTAFESTFFVAAEPQTVWDAITGDAGNRAVMWGSVLRGELAPGGRYEYVGPGEDGAETVHVYGEVLQAEAPRILQLVEHPGPSYRDNHAELTSRMTWRIEPAGPGLSKVVFTNDEWSPGNPAREHTSESWPLVLSSWKSYIETGRALPMG